MAKKIVVSAIALLILSCTQENHLRVNHDTLDEVPSTFVSPEMAIAEVEKFLEEASVESRAYSGKKIAGVYSTRTEETRAGDEEGEDPFVYVVNFEDNQGYALVAGDTRMQPIIAVTDSGALLEGDVIDNPGAVMMLAMAETDYKMTLGMPIEDEDGNMVIPIGVSTDGTYIYPDYEVVEDVQTRSSSTEYEYGEWTEYSRRGTQVGCEWGQSPEPYNKHTFAPTGEKAPAGCVATAVAQIMYYWGHNYTYDAYYFDWDVMHQHVSLYEPYAGAYDMIAELMLKLGLPANLDMSYTATGSYAYDSCVPRTFENFGYTSGGSIESYNYDEIYNIIVSRPVYVSGMAIKKVVTKKILGITVDTTTTYHEGHAWVIDQIMTRVRTKTPYVDGVPQGETKEYEHLVHCNFGWNGNDNGFYYSKKFNTNEDPVTRATTTKKYGTSGYYQYSLKMNTGIYL